MVCHLIHYLRATEDTPIPTDMSGRCAHLLPTAHVSAGDEGLTEHPAATRAWLLPFHPAVPGDTQPNACLLWARVLKQETDNLPSSSTRASERELSSLAIFPSEKIKGKSL